MHLLLPRRVVPILIPFLLLLLHAVILLLVLYSGHILYVVPLVHFLLVVALVIVHLNLVEMQRLQNTTLERSTYPRDARHWTGSRQTAAASRALHSRQV